MATIRRWSPSGRIRGFRPVQGLLRGELKIFPDVRVRVIMNLGDANPFDYGALVVYEHREKKRGKEYRYFQAEYWPEPETEEGKDRYTVYNWEIESNVFRDLEWISPNAWDAIADTHSMERREVRRLATSEEPVERAILYEMVGNYYGFDNLDHTPEVFTREELEARWPEYTR
jgi:hypothetical protein